MVLEKLVSQETGGTKLMSGCGKGKVAGIVIGTARI
jgi:hypothetical protein